MPQAADYGWAGVDESDPVARRLAFEVLVHQGEADSWVLRSRSPEACAQRMIACRFQWEMTNPESSADVARSWDALHGASWRDRFVRAFEAEERRVHAAGRAIFVIPE